MRSPSWEMPTDIAGSAESTENGALPDVPKSFFGGVMETAKNGPFSAVPMSPPRKLSQTSGIAA